MESHELMAIEPITKDHASSTSEKKKEKKGYKRQKYSLLPEGQDIFRITQGLDKNNEESVSFQFRRSHWYLRAKRGQCIIEPRRSTKHFEKECTFFPMTDLWFHGFVSFESTEKAAHYLRLRDGHLYVDRYNGTQAFKEEASFFLKKKSE
ncbi:otogelin-like protein isoform X2 [Rhopilema esculentum]|uniref:otogelin-like protein isoform X2 n=1 Tax=Rhopilema esculentum TaxID=499914 RepID=UPI0031D7CAB0